VRKGLAAGADHRGGAEVGERDLAFAERLRRRVATVEVLRALAESPEVDDARDPATGRGGGEVAGCSLVALGEVAVGAAAHRVDQVVGDLGPLQRRPQRLRLERVGADYLAARLPQAAGALGVPCQRPDLPPVLTQAAAKKATDVSGRAGNRDHLCLLTAGGENQA
jgi:hypothetical protein